MFIQTEETPNPATLKFLPGCEVMAEGSANFPDAAAAQRSPLALRLFQIDGVTGAFFGRDFITVAKHEEKPWYLIKPAILGVIMEHFTARRPLFIDSPTTETGSPDEAAILDEETDEVVLQIRELIDTRVRPAVAQDGGDIVFKGFERGIVYLHMQGACAGCPSATATLKIGIENMLRHYIPDVLEVRAVP